MHEALFAIRLIRNNIYEFESISCFQNYLLIGTKSGQILIYEVTPSVLHHPRASLATACQEAPLEFTHHVNPLFDEVAVPLPSFSVRACATHNLCKKGILQLQVVPEYGFFLALSEYQLAVYQLSDRQLIAVVPNSKGATQFAIMYQLTSATTNSKTGVSSTFDRLKSTAFHTEEVALPADGTSLSVNLCTCVKRKLYFFRWSPTKKTFVPPSEATDPSIASWPSEYTITEPARQVQFCGHKALVVALKSDYLYLNLNTLECRPISTPAKLTTNLISPLPYCVDSISFDETSLPSSLRTTSPNKTTYSSESDANSRWVLGAPAPFALTSDEQLFTISFGGGVDGSDIHPAFKWSGLPQCLQVFPPYLIAGLKNHLEVYSLNPCDLVQTLFIPHVRSMCVNGSGWLYAVAASSIYHPNDNMPDVTSRDAKASPAGHGSDVWLLLGANRLPLVQHLAQQKEFEMALKVASFTKLSGQAPISTTQLGALYAFHLFNEKRDIEGAFQIFYKLRTDPTIVIGLCPDMLCAENQTNLYYPSNLKLFANEEKPALFEPLIAFLVRWRNRLRTNCPREMSLVDFLEQSVPCGVIVNGGTVEKRRSLLLEVVDTALLKCYVVTNIARIGPLLRRENYCSFEEAQNILTCNGCFEDLVAMYKARGLHREALRCLTTMAFKVDADCSNQRPLHHPIVSYLKNLNDVHFDLVMEFGEWILEQHPRAWMSIFIQWELQLRHQSTKCTKDQLSPAFEYRNKVVRYLEQKAPLLVIPFLECLIFTPFDCAEEDEDDEDIEALNSMIMPDNEDELDDSTPFMGSPTSSTPCGLHMTTPKVIRAKSSGTVASKLQRQLASTPGSTNSMYLGTNPWQLSCLWPFPKNHHQRQHGVRQSSSSRIDEEVASQTEEIPDICLPPSGTPPPVELHNRYVRTLIHQIQSYLADSNEKTGDTIVARLRRRLLHFLQNKNAHYSTEEILPHLPYDSCFEERAILLARLKRHKQALNMWVHLLNNWEQALQHCADVQAEVERTFISRDVAKRSAGVQKEGQENSQLLEIYTTLVDVCLNPMEPITLGILPPPKSTTEGVNSKDDSYKPIDFRFKPRMDLALLVMRQFGELIDATKILGLTPDDLCLNQLAEFLESTLKHQKSLQARLTFFMNAALSESVHSRSARVEATAGEMFKVTALTTCHQCRRRIGTSAFVRYPDSGDLVHYGCCQDLPKDAPFPVK